MRSEDENEDSDVSTSDKNNESTIENESSGKSIALTNTPLSDVFSQNWHTVSFPQRQQKSRWVYYREALLMAMYSGDWILFLSKAKD